MVARVIGFALAIAVLLQFARPADAAEVARTTAQVKTALQQPAGQVDWVEIRLEDGLRQLADTGAFNLIIGSDVDRAQSITLTLDQVSVGTALAWALKLGGVSGVIRDGAVYVTRKPSDRVTTKVYPVADLLGSYRSRTPPGEDADAFDRADDELTRREKAEKLVEIIRSVTGAGGE